MPLVRPVLAVAVGFLSIACGEYHEYPTEQKRLAEIEVDGVTISVEASHYGSHYPFGRGEGKGGFLEPAYDVFHTRVAIGVTRADGKPIDIGWERYRHEGALLDQVLDSRKTDEDDLRERWDAMWGVLHAETCDPGDGRRAAVRLVGADAPWRVIVLDGGQWVATQPVAADDCDALLRELAAKQ